MLLTKLIRRYRAARDDRERGTALITIIGVMSVLLIIALTVASTTLSSATVATNSRAATEARAAADAGIDAVQAQMLGGAFVCALSRSTDPKFDVTVSYSAGGSPLACTGSALGGTPDAASVVSTGYAAERGISDADSTWSEGATMKLIVTPGGVTLDQAVFNEGSLSLTNNTTINGSNAGVLNGNVYSNGNVDCKTQNIISGTIYALNGITLDNNCKALGTVWAQGDLNFAVSGVHLYGDAYATGKITMGTGHVDGSVIANGDVSLADNSSGVTCASPAVVANVCGNVYSLNGNVAMGQNGSLVLGSVYARYNVSLGNISNNKPSPMGDIISLQGNLVGNSNANQVQPGGNAYIAGTITGFPSGKAPPTTAGKTCSGYAGTVAGSQTGTTGYTKCTDAQLVLPLPTAASPSLTPPKGFTVPGGLFTPASPTNLGIRSATTATVAVNPPARQGMPLIIDPVNPSLVAGIIAPADVASAQSAWASWYKPSQSSITSWMSSYAGGTSCTFSDSTKWTSFMTALKTASAGASKILVDFSSACPAGVSWSVGTTVSMWSDLTLMSKSGFKSQNGFTVGSSDSAKHSFLMIVPSDQPITNVLWTHVAAPYQTQLTPTCLTSIPNISFSAISEDSNNDPIFIYTPCNFSVQNTATLTAQIYSGSASYPNTVTLTRALMSVPGATIPGGASSDASYAVTVTTRYDISN